MATTYDLLKHLPSEAGERLAETLRRTCDGAIAPVLIVGSIALRYHLNRHGCAPLHRPLHDLDLAVSDVESLPPVEGEALLVSHYHPDSATSGTGRLLLQLVDPETALRIDIFHALPGAFHRASPLGHCSPHIFVACIEDVLVRSILVLGAQIESGSVEFKHVETIQRLSDIVKMEKADQLWATIDQGVWPGSIREAIEHAGSVLQDHPSLYGVLQYGRLDDPPCDQCLWTDRYPLAEKHRIFEILGYI